MADNTSGQEQVQERSYKSLVEGVRALPSFSVYKNSSIVSNPGHPLTVEDVVKAGLIANLNILLLGERGEGKTQLMQDTNNAFFSGNGVYIRARPDMKVRDLYEKFNITNLERELSDITSRPFTQIDEINRAPPKVQSSLLEGMQERQVTIGRETFELPAPFFVMATQNPIENLGTFPLPEAQVDRFMFKVNVGYPNIREEQEILRRNMTINKFESFGLKPIMDQNKILDIQEAAKNIFLHDKVERYIVSIVDATRNSIKYDMKLGKYIEWGASPRATLGLFIGAKAEALMAGKNFVTPYYVKKVALDTLRHRISINYEGQTEGVTSEMVIKEMLEKVPIP